MVKVCLTELPPGSRRPPAQLPGYPGAEAAPVVAQSYRSELIHAAGGLGSRGRRQLSVCQAAQRHARLRRKSRMRDFVGARRWPQARAVYDPTTSANSAVNGRTSSSALLCGPRGWL
jgi:hypothetical protein